VLPPGVLSTTTSSSAAGGGDSDDPGTDSSEGSGSGSGTAEASGSGLLPEDDLQALLAAVYKTGSAQLNEQVRGGGQAVMWLVAAQHNSHRTGWLYSVCMPAGEWQ
jgi:hypothetical protein